MMVCCCLEDGVIGGAVSSPYATWPIPRCECVCVCVCVGAKNCVVFRVTHP